MHGKRPGLDSALPAWRETVLLILSVALASATVAQTPDCTKQEGNVLRFENCGFGTGIAGWSALVGDKAIANLSEGDPTPGSFEIESVVPAVDDEGDGGDREIAIHSPCVPIAPSATYRVDARFRIADPSDAVQCGFFIAGYADATCDGAPSGTDSDEIRVTGPSWTSLSETYVSRAVDASMQVFTFCYEDPAGPVFTMLIDNFIADGPVSHRPIFSDGFESGDTSAWTRTVP